MYLRKRNNKWQCLIHYKGTRIAKTFIKKHQAERWAYSTKSQLDNNIFEDTTSLSSIKLKDLLKMYYEKNKSKSRRPKQFYYEVNLLCREKISKSSLLKLNSKDIADFRDNKLNEGKSASTVKKYLGLISRAYNIGKQEYALPIKSNPVSLIAKPKEPAGRDRVLSDLELNKLLHQAKSSSLYYMKAIIILAIETLCRRAELLNLKLEDINHTDKTAIIKVTKNNTPRTIGLSPKAIKEIQNLPKTFNGKLFNIGSVGGFEKAFRRCLSKAEIRDFHFHDLRHTGATKLAKQGWSVLELSAQGGWKTTSMLKRYVNLDGKHLGKRFVMSQYDSSCS